MDTLTDNVDYVSIKLKCSTLLHRLKDAVPSMC